MIGLSAISLFLRNINWGKALPKVVIIVLVLVAIGIVLLIKGAWDGKEKQITDTQAKYEKANAARIEAEATVVAYKAATDAQNKAIGRLETNLKTMQISMKEQQKVYNQRWEETNRVTNNLLGSAQKLINNPAAPPELEVPKARASLKDTKGYTLQGSN